MSELLYYYALGSTPAILIILFVFFRDRFREPTSVVVVTFLLGFSFVFFLDPIIILSESIGNNLPLNKGAKELYINLFRAAFFEEFFKFAILYYYCSKEDAFNEPMDAIVYGVAVSLGFAVNENIDYIFSSYQPQTEALSRITSTTMHAGCGVLMGMFLSKILFNKHSKQIRIFLALTIPVFVHGFYNQSISMNHSEIALIILLVLFIMILVLVRRFRKLQILKLNEAEIKYHPDNIIVLKSILIVLGLVFSTIVLWNLVL